MTDEKLVEVVARAIRRIIEMRNNSLCYSGDALLDERSWPTDREFARAAILAYEAAKGGAPAGWVMVPKAPTPEMVAAGEKGWMLRDLTRDDSAPIPDCYRAMLAAAPAAPSAVDLENVEEALAPFARWAERLDAKYADHEDDVIAGGHDDATVTFGEIRRARSVLSDIRKARE